jgi:hypothetical protein
MRNVELLRADLSRETDRNLRVEAPIGSRFTSGIRTGEAPARFAMVLRIERDELRRYVGFERPWSPAWLTVFAAAPALAIASQSSTEAATGASQKMCLPAVRQSSTMTR